MSTRYAGHRWIDRRGEAVTLHDFDPGVTLDTYLTPTTDGETAGTELTAVVLLKIKGLVTGTPGTVEQFDAAIYVKDDASVVMTAERNPEIVVTGTAERFRVEAKDTHQRPGVVELLCSKVAV